MSLRLRLTFYYSAVLAGILCVFGASVYMILGFTLTTRVDLTLRNAADEIILASSALRVLDAQFLHLPDLNRFGAVSAYVQVWTPDGQLEGQSDNLQAYSDPLDPQALQRGREGLTSVWIGGYHMRVFTVPLETSGDRQLLGYLQVATDLGQVDTAQSILLVVLVVGGLLAMILAWVIGWFSAHRALKPLKVITQTALQITRADDLSRRIPVPPEPHDEVGRLATAFNESLERLEKLFNAQRRFLADISHELRTPLTAIRGNVDLLRRMGGADSTSLDAIQSEAERMSRLVGDLLMLAQAESGNLPLVNQSVELDTLLLEVFREAQVLSAGVQVMIGEIDQAQVMGDRDRLKQLILNLVSNALKYTPEGGRVTLGLGRAPGHWARITVSDTGIGIPPDELPHIFERFYRVDKARSRTMGGAGLGLSIAHRIAQMHGGRIEAASDGQAGHGATFCVWLPLAPAKGTSAEVTRPMVRADKAKSGRGSQRLEP